MKDVDLLNYFLIHVKAQIKAIILYNNFMNFYED